MQKTFSENHIALLTVGNWIKMALFSSQSIVCWTWHSTQSNRVKRRRQKHQQKVPSATSYRVLDIVWRCIAHGKGHQKNWCDKCHFASNFMQSCAVQHTHTLTQHIQYEIFYMALISSVNRMKIRMCFVRTVDNKITSQSITTLEQQH